MNTTKFKAGDFVFYKDKDGATHATKVWRVTKKRLLVANYNCKELGDVVAVYVSPERCQLQSEWEKEHS